MDTIQMIMIGFDKTFHISFMNKSAEALRSMLGFNKLYEMLLKMIHNESADLKRVDLGGWVLEIHRHKQSFIISSHSKSLKFVYKVDYIEYLHDSNTSGVLMLQKPADNYTLREVSRVEEREETPDRNLENEKRKAEFFSNISHELKTPLNVIMGTQQLIDNRLSRGNISEVLRDREKYKDIINKNCFRLLRLINNLIDISKIDAGHYEVELVNCELVCFLEDIVQSVASYAESKQVQMLFQTNVQRRFMAFDCDKLERAILNLLSNAIKFTSPGGSIEVCICDKLDTVEISVKDTGIGIPQDMLDIIFERYKQLDYSLHGSMQGSGIGLSIVKSIVEQHLGTIVVTSEYLKGSQFTIALPVMLVDAGESKGPKCSQRTDSYINIELSGAISDFYEYN